MLLWQTFILGISTLARKIEITLKVMHLTRKKNSFIFHLFNCMFLHRMVNLFRTACRDAEGWYFGMKCLWKGRESHFKSH